MSKFRELILSTIDECEAALADSNAVLTSQLKQLREDTHSILDDKDLSERIKTFYNFVTTFYIDEKYASEKVIASIFTGLLESDTYKQRILADNQNQAIPANNQSQSVLESLPPDLIFTILSYLNEKDKSFRLVNQKCNLFTQLHYKNKLKSKDVFIFTLLMNDNNINWIEEYYAIDKSKKVLCELADYVVKRDTQYFAQKDTAPPIPDDTDTDQERQSLMKLADVLFKGEDPASLKNYDSVLHNGTYQKRFKTICELKLIEKGKNYCLHILKTGPNPLYTINPDSQNPLYTINPDFQDAPYRVNPNSRARKKLF